MIRRVCDVFGKNNSYLLDDNILIQPYEEKSVIIQPDDNTKFKEGVMTQSDDMINSSEQARRKHQCYHPGRGEHQMKSRILSSGQMVTCTCMYHPPMW